MSNVKKIEQDIRALSTEELATFREWFLEFDSKAWDEQIEQDAKTGKLGRLVQKSLQDYKDGKSSQL